MSRRRLATLLLTLTTACGGAGRLDSLGDGGASGKTADLGISSRGQDGADGGTATTTARDLAGAPPADLATPVCSPACGPNQACNNGSCENLPNSCPCPQGSYCDLSSNTCKAGCVSDTDCAGNDYCDTSARTCKVGFRSDSDCPNMEDACIAHVCQNDCASCGSVACNVITCVRNQCIDTPVSDGTACTDDGNVCTSDVCQYGDCVHPPVTDGTACTSDNNVCTSDVCASGMCVHNWADGTPCASDGNPCTDDECSSGMCAHIRSADGTICVTATRESAPQYCSSGTCTLPPYSCDCPNGYDNGCTVYQGDGGGQSVPSCYCITVAEILWTVQGVSTPETCTSCSVYGSDYVCW